jgi:carboxyl-terminal processing protease
MSKLAALKSLKTRTVSLPNVILIAVFVAMVSFVTGTRSEAVIASLGGSSNPSQLDFSSLNDIYDVLREKYDGKLDSQALIDGAKHGLVEATGDPYTAYFTAKEAKEFESELEGSFEGIGAELGKREDRLVVISTLDDSPAKSAGLMANDVIIKVNGEEAAGWTTEQAVSKIRGEKGTTVKLTVFRGEELKDFSITRQAITNPSVKSEITPDNVGILRISRFGDNDTVSLSRKAAEEFKARGVKAVILDLRGNGGGYINTAQAVASLWLQDKIVVTERGTNGEQTLRAENDAPLLGIKTIVLVDGGSASASEIVAGALSDHGAATLVGEKTFGKGSAQIIQDVAGGGQLKITVAKWYTPNGKNITKDGIKPGVEVKLTAEDINASRDPQKDKALELAR